jgi:hypothetical protein
LEDLIVFVLQLLGEVLLQIFAEALLEVGLRGLATTLKRDGNPYLASIGYPLLGAIVGTVSLWPFPTLFIHSHAGRIANAVVTPVIAGATMAAIGTWRRAQGQRVILLDRFAYGYLFALAMALVRLKFGS